ncbi:SseB family protein [Blastopirellula marina]|uniref:SseB protein N-terminal domain-containing protein n=1 Tax=Blastopirellula marina TaxID=124 RepID=A0A2S8GI19_9BACT|nr:SseB family protein [Blastopirellula marina]PQO44086.1 hypothetical protein C5Y93_21355 [Blastopirellula marina]
MNNRFDENHESPQAPMTSRTDEAATFAPANPLESALVESAAGRLEQRDFFEVFVQAEVYQIAEDAPQEADVPIFPIALQDPEHGRVIAVFSDPSRATPYETKAPHVLALTGSQVFEQIPAGHGIVLNPGSQFSLTIPGYGVLNLRRDFGIRRIAT